MANNKTTTNKTTTNTNTIKYIPKLLVNGQVITTTSKQVTCTIKGHEVTLNCCYINEHELSNAYKSQFSITSNEKNIEVHYAKVQNRVSATLYINDIIVFSSMSMQAIFTILNVAYGISKSHLNNLYVKSNTTRKQATKSVNSIVVNDTFEF